MAWQGTDGKIIAASPTVTTVRPQISPIDSRTVTCSSSSAFDDLDSATSPVGTDLVLLEVCLLYIYVELDVCKWLCYI